MTKHNDPNNPKMKTGDRYGGYRLLKIIPLNEIDATFYLLQHEAIGAQHIHISRPDKENAFGVTFKTVPTDSTGVAHILEHTALCGSTKYPVRDPFFSMIKRSLSTFMNAFTASDWTMYPFATQNAKDYFHLLDVYLDAAFFPLLQDLNFKQEGHRLEFEPGSAQDSAERLVYKGVVYNEMKGAMSSADQVMARTLLKAILPETTYGNNSGGDPAEIPRLTHAQLVAFHQRHYHPSNAFFYTYGNLPLEKLLAFIDEKIMQRFQRIDPKTEVPIHPRWTAPKSARYTYPLAPDEDLKRKSQTCLAWLTGDICQTFDVLVMAVLEQVLLGNPGSPLRKALMDSGLGSALSDVSGFDADNRDTLFACGLKNIDESDADQVAKLILDILEQLADGGIDPELVESAIHQIEFHRKEISNSPYPYGLKLLLAMTGSWLHGGSPERILKLDDDLERLSREIAKGGFLERRLRAGLLENPHRLHLVLAPDPKQSEREEKQVREELKARLQQMMPQDLKKIKEDARHLKDLQESQEDLSCLPTLAIGDIPPDIQACAAPSAGTKGAVWRYVQNTSDIFYYKLVAGAASVDETLLPWVPFYCYAFHQVGTRRHDFSTMARRIDAVTGGFNLSAQARTPFRQPDVSLPIVILNTKCLTRNIAATLAIVEELLAEVLFKDEARLSQLLGEYQAGLESMVVQNGHRLAISLSARNFTQANALSEQWSGVHQIHTIRNFTKNQSKSSCPDLVTILDAITRSLFQPSNVVMAVIGDEQQVDGATTAIENSPVLAAFKREPQTAALPSLSLKNMDQQPPYEGWSTSSAVAFVARTFPAVSLGHADAPALMVLSKMMRSLYLHREIREKGGAYGGFALYNTEIGLFSMASYRDPQVVRTLNVYAEAADFLQKTRVSGEDLKEAVLQVCSEIDKPDPPGPLAKKAFSRLIIGLDDETRLAFKQQLLKVSKDEVLAVAEKYLKSDPSKTGIAVIAGPEHLSEANKQLENSPLVLKKI